MGTREKIPTATAIATVKRTPFTEEAIEHETLILAKIRMGMGTVTVRSGERDALVPDGGIPTLAKTQMAMATATAKRDKAEDEEVADVGDGGDVTEEDQILALTVEVPVAGQIPVMRAETAIGTTAALTPVAATPWKMILITLKT